MKKFAMCVLVLAAVAFTACGIEEKECNQCGEADALVTDVTTPETAIETTPEVALEITESEPETTPEVDEETSPEIEVTPDVEPETICVPDCANKMCGDDGCGGECGTCEVLPCEGTPECAEGTCVYREASCDDGNPCTTEYCDREDSSCKYTAAVCDDANPCTEDTCDKEAGGCVYVTKACNDSKKCTTDSCNTESGECEFTPIVCDDGLNYTVDTCDGATGACVFTVATGSCLKDTDCADGNPCTVDVCDSFTHKCKLVQVVCNDDNPCTVEKCVPAPVGSYEYFCEPEWVVCDDGNACTWDYCDEETGVCIHGDASCNDGNACTVDSCNPATGCASELASCDDGNQCTADYCDPWVGCFYNAIPGCCNSNEDCSWDSWCNLDDNGGTCWALQCPSDDCGGYFVGSEHKCVAWLAEKGAVCDDRNADTDKTFCDGIGNCVECMGNNDCGDAEYCEYGVCYGLGCPKADPCWTYTATNHECEASVLPEGTNCGTDKVTGDYMFCDNSGNCLLPPPKNCDDGDKFTEDWLDSTTKACQHAEKEFAVGCEVPTVLAGTGRYCEVWIGWGEGGQDVSYFKEVGEKVPARKICGSSWTPSQAELNVRVFGPGVENGPWVGGIESSFTDPDGISVTLHDVQYPWADPDNWATPTTGIPWCGK